MGCRIAKGTIQRCSEQGRLRTLKGFIRQHPKAELQREAKKKHHRPPAEFEKRGCLQKEEEEKYPNDKCGNKGQLCSIHLLVALF